MKTLKIRKDNKPQIKEAQRTPRRTAASDSTPMCV